MLIGKNDVYGEATVEQDNGLCKDAEGLVCSKDCYGHIQ